jgi:hypothetical protein
LSEHEESDTRFAMPALDEPPLTEIGVILAGQDTHRLVAGLGAAGAIGDEDYGDPVGVVLLVDRLVHAGGDGLAAALATGADRWCSLQPLLAAVDRGPSVSASIRQAWRRALRTVLAADYGDIGVGPATWAHLAACWLRSDEVDRVAGELRTTGHRAAPPVAARLTTHSGGRS